MSDYINVFVIVEGKTEQVFVEAILKPYLAKKMIFISATQASKAGQKGGDICFSRVVKDIGNHLKQRSDTYITTFVDYYGTREWPGINEIASNAKPVDIAEHLNLATKDQVIQLFPELQTERRFIPYISMHEFETLLFSDSKILASGLDINEDKIVKLLAEKGEPEAINNSLETAPSKRLDNWWKTKRFPKTTLGINIARRIGVDKMREQCPVFNVWINQFELLVQGD